jgi:hypothetical protein
MDSASHIFVECVYARQVWLGCLIVLGIDVDIPCAQDSLQNWWKNARGRFRKKEKQGFDALVILIILRGSRSSGMPRSLTTIGSNSRRRV